MYLNDEFSIVLGATTCLQEVGSHPADSRRGRKKNVVLGEGFEQCSHCIQYRAHCTRENQQRIGESFQHFSLTGAPRALCSTPTRLARAERARVSFATTPTVIRCLNSQLVNAVFSARQGITFSTLEDSPPQDPLKRVYLMEVYPSRLSLQYR